MNPPLSVCTDLGPPIGSAQPSTAVAVPFSLVSQIPSSYADTHIGTLSQTLENILKSVEDGMATEAERDSLLKIGMALK